MTDRKCFHLEVGKMEERDFRVEIRAIQLDFAKSVDFKWIKYFTVVLKYASSPLILKQDTGRHGLFSNLLHSFVFTPIMLPVYSSRALNIIDHLQLEEQLEHFIMFQGEAGRRTRITLEARRDCCFAGEA